MKLRLWPNISGLSWNDCSSHIILSLVLLFNIVILVLDEDVEMNIKIPYNSFIVFNDRKKGRTINEADGRIKIQKDLKTQEDGIEPRKLQICLHI